ncbi:hypothetical protein PENTCL1PPCAC_18213 [Pristionchus entomophagus]|uniref:Uncharacterized protein n=1 Tax=Pristionchus entomophagus TaxID=358040 RepID=A0AAV5TP71_9BILA|nr:hypothetical protein PENTCL1PPCAC_18213 [Pristionchus entomophagus]
MSIFLLLSFLPFSVLADLDPSVAFIHAIKRQALYVCGTYPNQYYSTTPCNSGTGNQCANGGRFLGIGCYFDYQCTPYSAGVAAKCVGGCCCTDPGNGGSTNYGYCPTNGQQSQVSCTTNSGCSSGQTCNNGLCCTTTGQEYANACGGLGGLSACGANQNCGSFVCSTSNYCCECQYGRSSGLCANGCPQGYTCSSNGYCCSSCSNGQTPFGVCQNGLCPTGFTCNAGNVCCRN